MSRTLHVLVTLLAIGAAASCASRGKDLFVREGCVNCHRVGDLGNRDGIDLTAVGTRRDASWIATQVGTPSAHNPASRMPPFPQIKGFDLRSLITFLRR